VRTLAHAALVVGLPLLLSAVNVRLMASDAYLALAYAMPAFPAPVGMTAAERAALARASTAFIVDRSDPEALLALAHAGRPLYEPGEVAHLVDVRRLVTALSAGALLVGALLVAAAVSWWRGADALRFGAALRRGAWLTLGAVAGLSVGVALAWRTVFTLFHEILFEPGTWQFAASSGLIRLFPERFWFDAALILLAVTVAECALLILAGRRIERRPPVSARGY
jgi:integral membrane protein (TIGR01906 family)